VSAYAEYATRHRLRGWEALPWLAGLAAFFLFPNYLAFGTEVLITILFALSLDPRAPCRAVRATVAPSDSSAVATCAESPHKPQRTSLRGRRAMTGA
jgi:hypothetical protein